MTYLVYFFLSCVGFQCLFIIFILFSENWGIARWKNPGCGGMLFSYLHLFHCHKTFLVYENVDIINNLFGKNREREWKLTPSFPRGSSKLICRRYPKSFKRVITVSGEMRPSISFKWVITVTGEMAPSISYFPLFSPIIN